MTSTTITRRQFLSLFSLAGIPSAIAATAIKPDCLFSFRQTPKPEFGFGDLVDFFWTDEVSNDRHSETGEVVGIAWNFREQEWEYRVVWLSSTAYPADFYPNSDDHLVSAEVLCKH